jgi:hypothetical protein
LTLVIRYIKANSHMAKKTKKPEKKAKPATKPAAKAAAKPAKAAKPVKAAAKSAAKPAAAKKVVPASAPKKKAMVPPGKPPAKDAKKAGKAPAKVVAKAAAPVKAAKAAKPDPKATKKEDPKKLKNTPPPVEAKGKKGKKAVEVEVEETEDVAVEVKAPVKDVVLTDAEGRELCRVKDCDQPWVVEGYCRYHYLLFWKKIQNRKKILSEGKLEQYIEELTSRYPLKFLELIRKDLSSEPDFFSAIQELDIDEAGHLDESFEDENFMEEVRGIGSGETERVDDEY